MINNDEFKYLLNDFNKNFPYSHYSYNLIHASTENDKFILEIETNDDDIFKFKNDIKKFYKENYDSNVKFNFFGQNYNILSYRIEIYIKKHLLIANKDFDMFENIKNFKEYKLFESKETFFTDFGITNLYPKEKDDYLKIAKIIIDDIIKFAVNNDFTLYVKQYGGVPGKANDNIVLIESPVPYRFRMRFDEEPISKVKTWQEITDPITKKKKKKPIFFKRKKVTLKYKDYFTDAVDYENKRHYFIMKVVFDKLMNLYINQGRYFENRNDAWIKYINEIKNVKYKDKITSYLQKYELMDFTSNEEYNYKEGKFEIGDRVIGVGKHIICNIGGKRGTIVKVNGDTMFPYAVEFDERFDDKLHSSTSSRKSGKCLYVRKYDIKLDETPEDDSQFEDDFDINEGNIFKSKIDLTEDEIRFFCNDFVKILNENDIPAGLHKEINDSYYEFNGYKLLIEIRLAPFLIERENRYKIILAVDKIREKYGVNIEYAHFVKKVKIGSRNHPVSSESTEKIYDHTEFRVTELKKETIVANKDFGILDFE